MKLVANPQMRWNQKNRRCKRWTNNNEPAKPLVRMQLLLNEVFIVAVIVRHGEDWLQTGLCQPSFEATFFALLLPWPRLNMPVRLTRP